MLNVRVETDNDVTTIYHINAQGFGREKEAEFVNHLRDHHGITLSLVAEYNGLLVGHALFSPVRIEPDGAGFNSVTLTPLAVLPEYQRRGIGSMLVREGMEKIRSLGHDIIFLVGHPEYYPRLGFTQAKPKGFRCEFDVPDEAWMLLEAVKVDCEKLERTVYFRPEFRMAMESS
ncbi:MAG: N-acetyltransferase [Dehalococcoidaceae bacterium]|nr:N-acetyltransferase [Dehalococcoidaceae bacterium]